MTNAKVFTLKDADFVLAASVTPEDGEGPAYVTIMDLERDQFITLKVDDFRRMAEAVERSL